MSADEIKTNDELSVCGKVYRILRLLGHGKGGYSYLAEGGGERVVLKQIHPEPCAYYSFGNKIEAERCDYERLRRAGIRVPEMLALDAEAERELESADLPQFSPSFLGERNDPAARGELSGLTLDNFRIGKVAAALARGIAENLRRMLPEALLDGKSRLAASGNGFRRNRSLCRAAELVFGIPLVRSAFTEEAACGAALLFAHTNSGSGD